MDPIKYGIRALRSRIPGIISTLGPVSTLIGSSVIYELPYESADFGILKTVFYHGKAKRDLGISLRLYPEGARRDPERHIQ